MKRGIFFILLSLVWLWASGVAVAVEAELVEDIYIGEQSPGIPGSSFPKYLTEFNGELFFIANDGYENKLWRYDGTNPPEIAYSQAQSVQNLYVAGDILYFSGDNSLFAYDGSAFVRVEDDLSDPPTAPFGGVGDRLFFSSGLSEIWKSDATAGTAQFIGTISGSYVDRFVPFDGTLYFSSGSGITKIETPGNTPALSNFVSAQNALDLTAVGEWLFWYSYMDMGAGDYAYLLKKSKSDPADPQTVIWQEDPNEILDIVAAGNQLYIFAIKDSTTRLYRLANPDDTTAQEIYDFGNVSPEVSRAIGEQLFFVTYNPHYTLYSATGDQVNALASFESIYASETLPGGFEEVNGILYFTADDGSGQGTELWRSDGTEEGTVLVADIYPDQTSGSPTGMTEVNGDLFFAAEGLDPSSQPVGTELFKISQQQLEYQALIDLYNSTDGPNWTWMDDTQKWTDGAGNFRLDRVCQNWEGITCDSEGHVTQIALGEKGLNGSLPDSLVDLPYLRQLHLGGNSDLGGELSGIQWVRFSDLTQLSIYDCAIQGDISEIQWGTAANPSPLTHLNLGNNQLGGNIEDINWALLSNLQVLVLGSNNLEGDIGAADWTALSDIRELYLNENENLNGDITDVFWDALSQLEYLSLYGCGFEGNISNLLLPTSLTHLELMNNQLIGGVGSLTWSEFNDLQKIDLAGNKLEGSVDSLSEIPAFSDTANPLEGDLRWNALYLEDETAADDFEAVFGEGWQATQTLTPTDFEAEALSDTEVELSWTYEGYAIGGTQEGFVIEYWPSSDANASSTKTISGKSITSASITGLDPDKNYQFQIAAYTGNHENNNNIVYSEYSDPISPDGTTQISPGDYYVDAVNGDDANDGTSEETAWKTLHHAISQINNGNPSSGDPRYVLHVAPGTYGISSEEPNEQLRITQSYLTIQGEPNAQGEKPTLDDQITESRDYGIEIDSSAENVIIFDLEIKNFSSYGIYIKGNDHQILRCDVRDNGSKGIKISGGNNIEVKDCHIYSSLDASTLNSFQEIGIEVESAGTGTVISDNRIENHSAIHFGFGEPLGGQGIAVYDVDSLDIKRNIIRDNYKAIYVGLDEASESLLNIWNNLIYATDLGISNWGIYISNYSDDSNVTLYHNTVDGIQYDGEGVGVYFDGNPPAIKYNIFSNCDVGAWDLASSTAQVSYNDFFNAGYFLEGNEIQIIEDLNVIPGNTGNITDDPLYYASGDYHLTEGSFCVDIIPSSEIFTDLDSVNDEHNRRPQGDGYDMGCYEYLPEITTCFLEIAVEGSGTVSYRSGEITGSCPHTAGTTDPCGYEFPIDSQVRLTAIPEQGFELAQWREIIDGSQTDLGSQNPLTVGMTICNKRIMAVFEESEPSPGPEPPSPPSVVDRCPDDPDKTAPGECGCGVPDVDTDGDGVLDCKEDCPNDPDKTEPGQCGCGEPDTDSDGDQTADCKDECPNDPNKTEPGQCGCGTPDIDSDGDGTMDCGDQCPNDPDKTDPGVCGCGTPDIDSDGDGTMDCGDQCPNDPDKTAPGQCGCGTPDIDSDGDGIADCNDTDDNGDDDEDKLVSFSLRIEPGTRVQDFVMISFNVIFQGFPLARNEGVDAMDVLGESLGGVYDTYYHRIGTYDPQSHVYIEADEMKIRTGHGYWVLAREGMDIGYQGTEPALPVERELIYNPQQAIGWNMVGPPDLSHYDWELIQIVGYDENGEMVFGPQAIGELQEDNPYIDTRLWRWNSGEYLADTEIMEKTRAYWVKVKQPGVALRFTAGAQVGDEQVLTAKLRRQGRSLFDLLSPGQAVAADDTPPMPPGGLSDTPTANSRVDEGGGACFIQTSADR